MQHTYGEALTPARNQRIKRRIAWGLCLLGLAAVVLAGQRIYVYDRTPPAEQSKSNVAESTRAEPKVAEANASAKALPGSLLATIAELKGFVENERGLKFKKEVDVTLLSDADFKARLIGDAKNNEDKSAEESSNSEALFRALKLIEDSVDLNQAGEDAAAEGVLGFYDTRTDQLVVRGEKTSPFVKTILVHELTHALQAQYFDIDRPELYEADDDSALGLDAVVEGDATRIENRYFESLNAEEQRLVELELEQTVGSSSDSEVPETLLALISFPYQVGPQFLAELEKAGGTAKVDAALKDPPKTAEGLLHPERYLKGEGARKVAKPAADGVVFDDGMVGELGLILLLSQAMPPQDALEAADGWGGDQYVAWRTGEGACVRFDLVMDTPKDFRQASSALKTWARMHGSATVKTSGETIGVTACA